MKNRNINEIINLDFDQIEAINHCIENFMNKEAKDFLSLPIDLNSKNQYGMSYLLNAVTFDNFDIVQYLINNGADINIKNSYGQSAIDFAIEDENFKIIKYLIDNGSKTC